MDFFKSAVASIAKGPAFPYTFGDRVDIGQSIWNLHNGTKREDGSKCSVYSFSDANDKSRFALARNALRKLRTLRHPGMVKVLDTLETDQLIYIAVERIVPLSWAVKRRSLSEDSIKWGLHDVAKTIKFINDEAASVHGNIRLGSIFTSESGEWKVGGVEILSSLKEDDGIMFSRGSLVPGIEYYTPPEVVRDGWESVKKNPPHAVDAYQYGILVHEVFNHGHNSGEKQIGSTENVPLDMHASYKRLTHNLPKMRLSVANFLVQGTRHGGFFDIPLIQLSNGVESFGLKNESEKAAFLRELEPVVSSEQFPEDFFRAKVLPELLKSVEFGGGGPRALELCMRIASKMPNDEWDTIITPVIVRLFACPDRAIRVCLLNNLPIMIDHFNQKLVTNSIFPQIVTGFGDVAPVVREQTVKAVLVAVPKLSDRVINGELLRHLAKTANDGEPGIRTNTTICLGKLARSLNPSSRAKVLNAAFSRSLRDPFVHARHAALMALAATADIFTENECATQMLPAICPSLVDKEKLVRDQANKTLNIYLERVGKYARTLPDTVLPPPGSAASGDGKVAIQSTGGATQQWMGWAVSSFTNKLSSASGEMRISNAHETKPATVEKELPTVSAAPAGFNIASPVPQPVPTEEELIQEWGAMDNADGTPDPVDPWAEPPKPATPTVAHDDNSEADFEGWLNAQAAAKSKKPLPKGLTKKATPLRAPKKTTTKAPILGNRPASRATPQPVAKKDETTQKDDDDDDDGWGDAWS
ncbi:ARM repeat-containing protein [Piedraia hortae CBS 480.64]|uniref:ARM repeat-containing protein n=1 Tax=Piedraia hortae CBS 480.64 TaxID=1314780 RepID=A0A6A7CAJ1_9PEZI|nr:ARM repeat-containing protein [Piedraia hortae CBS 480.64]